MKKIVQLLFILLSPIFIHGQKTNAIVAELRLLGTGTCSSDSGILNMTYLIRPNILRVDLKGPYANGSVIYQPSSEKIWVLFHVEKIYYSMNVSQMDSMKAKIQEISDQLEADYANKSEKEKAEIDAHWALGNPLRKQDIVYSHMKKEDSLVSQLVCEKYRADMPGNMSRFAYLNDLKTTGIKDEELKILEQFAAFMGTGMNSLTANLDLTTFRKWKEGGYPIFIKNVSGKNVCHETWAQFIYRTTIRDEDYQIPFNYRKEKNPLGTTN